MVKILLAVIFIITGSSTYARAFLFQREMIPLRKMTLCKHGDNRCLGNHSLYAQRSDTVKMSKMEHHTEMKQHIKSMVYLSLLLAIKPSVATASDIITTQTTTASTYQLSRILFLRLLAIVYTAAFSVAKIQNKGLIGDNGILPARNVLNDAESRGDAKQKRRKEWLKESKAYQSKISIIDKCKNYFMTYKPIEDFWHRTDRMNRPLPTLLWFARDRNQLNPWLDNLANVGLFLSSIMLMTGSANVLLIAGLYIIQRSFMSVGAEFYGYGWEPQLAELTFHTLFLVSLLSMNPFFESVPKLVIWSIRFYLFKVNVYSVCTIYNMSVYVLFILIHSLYMHILCSHRS